MGLVAFRHLRRFATSGLADAVQSAVLPKERPDFLAGELGAEAAPVDFEGVVVAWQQISFVRHPRLREGLVEDKGLVGRDVMIACAEQGYGWRCFVRT
jgi:hypothetical protein